MFWPWFRALTTAPAENCPSCTASVARKGSSHKELGQYCRRTLRSYIARNSIGAHLDNILAAWTIDGALSAALLDAAESPGSRKQQRSVVMNIKVGMHATLQRADIMCGYGKTSLCLWVMMTGNFGYSSLKLQKRKGTKTCW